jgi:aldose 1-epimerase
MEKCFKVCKEKFGAYESYKLSDCSTGEYASILPFIGGSINGLTLKCNNELIKIIDEYESVEDVLLNLHNTFKGSNLFPFPNRIADGMYIFAGQKFSLPLNFKNEKNAIHGLVYDQQFDVVNQGSGHQGCFLTLQYLSPDICEGYPFKYKLKQIYFWKKNRGFGCITLITNLSNCEMPVGHGWHPYFKAGTDIIDDLAIQFPSVEIIDLDQRNIPTGRSSIYNEFKQLRQIGNIELDNCFRLKRSNQYADIVLSNLRKNFHFKIRQETGVNKYNHLQIYTPPDRASIAIEPMTCAPNAFNNKDGLITLTSGSTISLFWSISKCRFDGN